MKKESLVWKMVGKDNETRSRSQRISRYLGRFKQRDVDASSEACNITQLKLFQNPTISRFGK